MNLVLTALLISIVSFEKDPVSEILQGNWKLVGTLPSVPVGQDSVLVLMETNGEAGDWNVLATGISAFKGTKVKAKKLSTDILELSLHGPVPLECVFKLPQVRVNQVPGAFNLRGKWFPCVLEKSTVKTLDGTKLEQPSPGSDQVEKMIKANTHAEKIQILREIVRQYHASPAVLVASGLLVENFVKDSVEKDLNAIVEIFEKTIQEYPIQLGVESVKIQALSMCKKKWHPEIAAQLLENIKLHIGQNQNSSVQRAILKMESSIYPLVGKPELGQQSEEKLETVERELDAAFDQSSVPFPVENKTLGGFSPKNPAVLELFTGAQCPPCVAAEVAFDALNKSYVQGDLVLLQYHLHIPAPDRLTNAYSETRARYYGINSTPKVFINGEEGLSVGGPKGVGKASFDSLCKSLENYSRKKEQAAIRIELTVLTQGAAISVGVKYQGVSEYRRCLLRLMLVEETVRYPGGNGQRLHHQVVRGSIGDPKGFGLSGTQGQETVRFNIVETRKQIEKYWEDFQTRRPFLDDERPQILEKLRIVAMIQDIESKEIIQAARISIK